MKPLNYDDNGCNNISSNCVIWQGPDIKCINLCKGDTVSDVIYKLAMELCEILDILKVSTYDLDCFTFPSGPPQNFTELIQFLIEKVCNNSTNINNLNTTSGARLNTTSETVGSGTGTNCPDCTLDLASCFYYVDGFGNTITTAQLTDYATAMGNKICALVTEINTLQIIVNDNTNRIIALENAPPPVYNPPLITPTCVLPSVLTSTDIVLAALETQFCELRTATGNQIDIYTNITKQCAGLNTDNSLTNTGLTMSSIPGWTSVVSNMAQAFGNMWLTVCDLRTAVRNIQLNCCPTGCDGIELSMTADLNATILKIYITGTIPSGFVECTGNTAVKITDSNGSSIIVNISLFTYLNAPGGYSLDLTTTPINSALDISIDILPCLTNPTTNATCKSCLEYTVASTADCPEVTLTAGITVIDYSFTSLAGNYTYTVELYDNTYGTLLQTQTQAAGSSVPVTGSFSTLTASTQYHVRVSIVPTACLECPPTVCPFNTTTTLPPIIL